MNNKKWYDIDVKDELLNRLCPVLSPECAKVARAHLVDNSSRDLMEADFWNHYLSEKEAAFIALHASQIYFDVRNSKYGTNQYFEAAFKERKIGYKGQWRQYIAKMLQEYVNQGNKILFTGTANGSEIPQIDGYLCYAMDQLKISVKQIRNPAIIESCAGDFEDSSFTPWGAHYFTCVVALRCLTPNARLNNFFSFCANNLDTYGVIILSYPLSYLDCAGKLVALPNIELKIDAFKQSLFSHAKNFDLSIIKEQVTDVEHFWIIKERS